MYPLVEAIAYHGWGFDHSCWQLWKPAFALQGIALQGFDRGYFGHPAAPRFSTVSSRKIILTHSYGLHLCPPEHLHQADLVVIFSGFQSFHPSQPTARRRSQLTLQQMIRQFEQSPQLVLATFRATCYDPVAWEGNAVENLRTTMDWLNAELLLQDLRALNTAWFDMEQLKNKSKILVVQGECDRITPPERAQALAQQLPASHYIEVPGAGHALPLTHWADGWRSLVPLLQDLPTV